MKELEQQLAKLPGHDVSALRAAEIRQRAHGELARVRRQSELGRVYRRYLEPAWVSALCAIHLGWAFLEVLSLYR